VPSVPLKASDADCFAPHARRRRPLTALWVCLVPYLKLFGFDGVIRWEGGRPASGTMTPFFPSIFPALFRLGDLSRAIWQWKRWASERAAIKAEVTQAKQTVDLLRMARAITRLDALDAEIDAIRKKPNRTKVSRLRESPRRLL
jgi:hypothetical protein